MLGVKLYRTVTQEIGAMIRDGSLAAGDQLPSVRALSQSRKVSPATVLKAYEALEANGLVEARPRSGYYVREIQTAPMPPRTSRPRSNSTRLAVSDLVLKRWRRREIERWYLSALPFQVRCNFRGQNWLVP